MAETVRNRGYSMTADEWMTEARVAMAVMVACAPGAGIAGARKLYQPIYKAAIEECEKLLDITPDHNLE